jgi:glycosyltransferase involved in cell wall biosynthesis
MRDETAENPRNSIDLTVVVPVYDELDNLEALVQRVRDALGAIGVEWELVAVDDGSTDGSGERLDELASLDARLRVLHLSENFGQSAALDAGFRHSHGELIAILDADLQTYPEDLPELLRFLREVEADCVVGIRAAREDTAWKRFSSRFANKVRNWLTRDDIVDTGCPIKLVRAEAIRSLPSFDGMHRFFPTLLRMGGFDVRQVPVRHNARLAGRSKYGTWDRAVRGLRDAWGVRWLQDRRLRWKIR